MNHLLVIRLSALGDAAILAPVLRQFVDSTDNLPAITVAAPPLLEPLFNDIPGIQFLGVEKRQSVLRLYRIFRHVGADAVADMHCVNRINHALILLRLDALIHFRSLSIRHIHKGRISRTLFLLHLRKRPLPTQAHRYADVLRRLHLITDTITQSPSTGSGTVGGGPESVEGHLHDNAISKTLGFAPFAQHQGKIWPQKYSEQLLQLLISNGYRVILFGSKEEAPLLHSIVNNCATHLPSTGSGTVGGGDEAVEGQSHNNAITVLAGTLSFAQELEYIRHLSLMVTMDSANMHFASAVGTPVLSIWGATHPHLGFYGYGQSPDNALCANLPCQPCSHYGQRPCRYRDYPCLRAITPTIVMQRIHTITQ